MFSFVCRNLKQMSAVNINISATDSSLWSLNNLENPFSQKSRHKIISKTSATVSSSNKSTEEQCNVCSKETVATPDKNASIPVYGIQAHENFFFLNQTLFTWNWSQRMKKRWRSPFYRSIFSLSRFLNLHIIFFNKSMCFYFDAIQYLKMLAEWTTYSLFFLILVN